MAKRSKAAKRRTKKTGAGAIGAGYEYDTIRIRDEKTGRVRHSVGNGDAIAKAMLIYTAGGGKLSKIVKDNELKIKPQGDRSEGLYRMSVGVALRAKVRAGTAVKIGSITVKKLTQKVDVPKVEIKAAAAKSKSASKKSKPIGKSRAKPARKRAAKPKIEAPAAAAGTDQAGANSAEA